MAGIKGSHKTANVLLSPSTPMEDFIAIVKAPALSIDASGNVGGICYSKWRSLSIAKSAWTGTVPNTTKQIAQQVILTAVSKDWGQTLNIEERKTWSNLAKAIVWSDRFGSPYIPNGYQLFMKWNIRRKVMGLAIMKVAPSVQEKVYVKMLAIQVLMATLRIKINLLKSWYFEHEGYGTEYYKAGPYDSGGRSPIEGEWRFLDRQIPPNNYWDMAVVINKWYWYRGRQISEFGDVGNWFQEQVQFA